jgi:hypothetical protein
MRCVMFWSMLLLFASANAYADKPTVGKSVIVYGQEDAKSPGWAILTDIPTGWTQDCCQYAKAIGVNLVLYQGDWTGEPDGVIVLNVWSSKLPTLEAELSDDGKQYIKRDPSGKVGVFPLSNPAMTCRGVLYQGTDHVDDAVVFCDPGKKTGVRFSWSMTVKSSTPQRQNLLDSFRKVAEQTTYMEYQAKREPAKH